MVVLAGGTTGLKPAQRVAFHDLGQLCALGALDKCNYGSRLVRAFRLVLRAVFLAAATFFAGLAFLVDLL
jgi:hypothetical protein